MLRLIIIITSIVFLSGCAVEKNVSLPESFWQSKPRSITVALVKPESARLIKMGQQGILDYAINSAMTNTLNNYLSHRSSGWYYSLRKIFANNLSERSLKYKISNMLVPQDNKKYYYVATQNNGAYLLLLELEAFGAIRNYYSFIPTSAPKALCSLSGKLIDMETNQIIWRHLARITIPVQGNWDQPPSYPNLTHSLNIAIKTCRQEIVDSFFSGH